jgi:hypothetical protein
VDPPEVLVSNPAQTQDEEMLNVDDWFDGPVSELGGFELRGYLCREAGVGKCFRDRYFHGGERG